MRIPDALKSRFEVDSNHAAKMKCLEQQVVDANTSKVKRALAHSTTASTQASTQASTGRGPASTPTNTPARTACVPQFTDQDKPLDVTREVDLASLPAQDFRSSHQCANCMKTVPVMFIVISKAQRV